jgi:hypothetical protein
MHRLADAAHGAEGDDRASVEGEGLADEVVLAAGAGNDAPVLEPVGDDRAQQGRIMAVLMNRPPVRAARFRSFWPLRSLTKEIAVMCSLARWSSGSSRRAR